MKTAFFKFAKEDIYYEAILLSHQFWEAQDFRNKSNKAKIFKRLYMVNVLKAESLVRISSECFIAERTLYRYRNEFVQMYSYFLNSIRENNGEHNKNLIISLDCV